MLCYSITSPLRYFDFDNGGGLGDNILLDY